MIRSVCFTGHRYIKKPLEQWAFDALDNAVQRASDSGARWFTSGGAPYWDLWFLVDAMAQRWEVAGKPNDIGKGMHGISGLPYGLVVMAALPFPGFWDFYKDKRSDDKIFLTNLEKDLDVVGYISDGDYTPTKMHIRNRWLVDNHDAVIALYDGRKEGGTFATLKYARSKGKPILWLDPVNKTERWIME